MYFKKSSSLLLAISFVLIASVFVSCDRNPNQITLNLWHIYADQSRGVPIEAAARRFEAANPGVRVVISTNPNDPYKTKLKTVGPNDFPDVFHSWGGGWLQSFVDVGYVADITDEVNAIMDQLNPALVNFNKFNGRIWGIPYTAGTTILYYNKDIFSRLNLQPPNTFADLERISEVLLANNITPFALANRTQWPGAQHFVLLSMRLGGGDIFDRAQNGEVLFTDPVFVQAGDMLMDMVDKGWFPAGANGLDWDTGQSRMLFYTEQCAMIVQTGGLMGTMRTENRPFYDEKLGIALYPAIEGRPGKATDILAGENAWSVSANSRNLELAKKLAIFLATDRQVQQEIQDNGILAAKPGLNISDPNVRAALYQLEHATYLQNYIDQTLSPEMADVHKSTTQALFGRTMTSLQAAETMQRTFLSQ